MITFRWIAIVGFAALLGACSETFMTCPSPGGITANECNYTLTIQAIGPEKGLVIGTVARSVVEANITRGSYGFLNRGWLGDWFVDYKVQDYQFHKYPFHVQEPETVTEKDMNKDVQFVNVPNTFFLKRKM